MRRSQIRWAVLAFFIFLGSYSAARFELTHSLTHFIPSQHESEWVELSLELVHSPLARRMVLSIGGGPERREVARKLADYLSQHPEVLWVQAGFGEQSVQSLYDLYFERRMYFVSEDPEAEVPELFENESLSDAANALKLRLAGPMSVLPSRTAPGDPLGFFERILQRFRASQPARLESDGSFSSVDGEYALVLLELRSSPFDSESQKPLLRDIDAEFSRLENRSGGELDLEQSGVNRVSVATEQSVRSDVSLVSTLSIGLVCGLFLLVFRSFRQLAIVVMAPSAGFLAALAVSISLPDPLHGITLAFGFVLIGVAIDYPIHLINHFALCGGVGSSIETIKKIRPSLVLSAVTTTLAFLALSASDFPGLREMGIFAAIGVPVALLITLWGLPAFLPQRPQPTRAQEFLSAHLENLVDFLRGRRALWILVGVGLILSFFVGLAQLRWKDDPADLMTPDPAVLAESERVRKRVSDIGGGQYVVGRAPDRESALVLNDAIYARLEAAREAGEIGAMRSLHPFLWSRALQLRNVAALRRVEGLDARIDRAFFEQGFKRGSFDAFGASIAAPPAEPLRLEDLEGSLLDQATDLLVEMEDDYAVLTYLENVSSPEALRLRLADLENAHFIDQKEVVAGVYRDYRRSTLWLVALGSAVALLVLFVRYRSVVLALLAFTPAVVGALGALSVFGMADHPVNVIAAISLLVVLGMGIDYGIFCVDSTETTRGPGVYLSGLTISCLTSVFVFGALAWSSQTALQSVGLTPAVGISLAFLISPVVVAVAERHRNGQGTLA